MLILLLGGNNKERGNKKRHTGHSEPIKSTSQTMLCYHEGFKSYEMLPHVCQGLR